MPGVNNECCLFPAWKERKNKNKTLHLSIDFFFKAENKLNIRIDNIDHQVSATGDFNLLEIEELQDAWWMTLRVGSSSRVREIFIQSRQTNHRLICLVSVVSNCCQELILPLKLIQLVSDYQSLSLSLPFSYLVWNKVYFENSNDSHRYRRWFVIEYRIRH